MIERGQNLRLALEAGQPVAIEREELGEDLERDVAIERCVAGAIHLAHAARAERREDLVGTELNASANGHREPRVARESPIMS